MKRGTSLKVLNALLALLMVSQFLSGVLNEKLSKETFAHIHVLGGLLIVAGVILHVVLNWGWVKANFFKKP